MSVTPRYVDEAPGTPRNSVSMTHFHPSIGDRFRKRNWAGFNTHVRVVALFDEWTVLSRNIRWPLEKPLLILTNELMETWQVQCEICSRERIEING